MDISKAIYSLLGGMLVFAFSIVILSRSVFDDFFEYKNKELLTEQSRELRLLDSEVFDRKMKCQEIVEQQMERFNNITGGYYDSSLNSCMVAYTNTEGETEYSDVQDMEKRR